MIWTAVELVVVGGLALIGGGTVLHSTLAALAKLRGET